MQANHTIEHFDPQARENYEKLTGLMNELSLYIMFGLGFILLQYVSQMTFSLISSQFVPYLLGHRIDEEKFKKGKGSPLYRAALIDDSLDTFMKERGCWYLGTPVQTYNAYIKHKGLKSGDNPFQVLVQMKEQGIIPDTTTYNTLIDFSFQIGNVDAALELFGQLTKSKSDAQPDVISYNIYLKGMIIRFNKRDLRVTPSAVSQVFKEMNARKLTPNAISYNTIIDLCFLVGVPKDALCYYEEMSSKNILPDLYTYSILVKGLKHSPENGKAYYGKLFSSIKEYIQKHKGEIDEILFNSLIDTAVHYKDFEKINSILLMMKEHEVSHSTVTYGILIKAYGQNNMVEQALNTFEEMKTKKVEINEVTFGCIIDACIKSSRFMEAQKLYEEMKGAKIPSNIVICTTLLKGYAKQKDFARVWEMYEQVVVKREIQPNIVFYNAFLESLIQCQKSDLLWEVYKQIEKEGASLKPDIITYSTLIKGLCKGHYMDEILVLYEQMKKRNIAIDEVLYNSIMHGLNIAGRTVECHAIYQDMISQNIPPSNVTYSIIIKLYSKSGEFEKALAMFDCAEKDKIELGIIVYTCMIQGCIKHKNIEKAVIIFEKLKMNPAIVVDQVIYNTIVNGCVYAGQLQKACLYTQWAIKDGIIMASDIYNNVLKNILTSKIMAIGEKKSYSEMILRFIDSNQLEINESIKEKSRRLTGQSSDFRSSAYQQVRQPKCKYIPKK